MDDRLSEDLAVEILCRLPVKSLMLCKRVSKGWYNLISNVCVPNMSRISSTTPSGFLFTFVRRKISSYHNAYVSYPQGRYCDNDCSGFLRSCIELLPCRPYQLQDACNGLLLFFSADGRYYVCNPTTKQCIAVPYVQRKYKSYFASLVIENFMSPHYKIIRFPDIKFGCSFIKLDVFSSATGNWVKQKLRIEQSVFSSVKCIERTVYLNGKLYRQSMSEYLLCFDLDNLIAKAIQLPVANSIGKFGFIGLSKGQLYYANHDSSKSNICFWILEDCFWRLKYCLSISHLMSLSPQVRELCKDGISTNFMPYAIHPSADIVFLGFPTMLLSYNFQDENLEVIFKMVKGRLIYGGKYMVYPYSPSFIVLNDFTKHPPQSSLI